MSKGKKKEVVGVIKLQVPVGKANPAPPIGPALGQKGLNIMDFCKEFNAMKFAFDPGTPIPVTINAYKDRSFDFTVKSPPVSYLILKELKIKKGSGAPGKETVGRISKTQLEAVAHKKMADMNSSDLKACMKMVAGTAIAMGLEPAEID